LSQLLLYRASAGSGKTFELVFQYLLRIFEDQASYRSILAVTFTNKAADEMKGRIFQELHRLDKKPDSSPYLSRLVRSTGRTEEWISNQAGKIKTLMLHDYSKISVETIDHFFQGILKSFARESGLSSGYQLELDTERVLKQFVTYVFDHVRKDPSVRKWLIEWVTERMEEGEKWHKLEADLVNTGFELLKEEIIGMLLQPGNGGLAEPQIRDLQQLSRKIISRFRTELENISQQFRKVLDEHGLSVEEFSFGKLGPAGYLFSLDPAKAPGARSLAAIDDPSKWVKKGSARETEILNSVFPLVNDLMKRTALLFEQNEKDYKTAVAVSRNLFALWFSSTLLAFLKQSAQKSNEILLTLTQPLIQLIIKDNPTPFIFERTGTYIKHYLIDEFQDTSDLQWKNFLPLLENSLSEDGFGLVVGDVKQSLYRWRNSNWKLIHRQAAIDLKKFGIDSRDLSMNHRSGKSIIDFNNAVFPAIPGLLIDKLKEGFGDLSGMHEDEINALEGIYGDAVQQPGIHSDTEGMVEIHVIDDSAGEIGWREQIALKLPLIVQDLLVNRGYRQNDILFLVRNNREAGVIAGILNEYRDSHPDQVNQNWSFVSNDVFRIGAAENIRILLSVFEYLVSRELFYLQYLDLQLNLSKHPGGFPDPDQDGASVGILKQRLDELKGLDPLSVVDEAVVRLGLGNLPEERPYLFQFRDLVRQYREKGAGHIEGFLEWWEVSGAKSKLVTEGLGEAMQIMTIHRSKGLSCPVVLIPFCNWPVDHSGRKNPWIWADTGGTPFNLIPKVPVRYGAGLRNTWFDQAYRSEKLEAMLDNLNLLYVAFTRAEEVLIAMCPVAGNQLTVANAVAANLPVPPIEGVMRLGDQNTANTRTKAEVTDDEMLGRDFIPFRIGSLVKPLLTSIDEARRYGILVHRVMETIKTASDADQVLTDMVNRGECKPSDLERIQKNLATLFEIPEVRDWFSGSWEVMTEPVILVPGSGDRRPDRFMHRGQEAVILDYKTGSAEPEHIQQVSGYMKLIRQMGYPGIKGYLLYLDPPQLTEVKGPSGFVQPSLFDQEA